MSSVRILHLEITSQPGELGIDLYTVCIAMAVVISNVAKKLKYGVV